MCERYAGYIARERRVGTTTRRHRPAQERGTPRGRAPARRLLDSTRYGPCPRRPSSSCGCSLICCRRGSTRADHASATRRGARRSPRRLARGARPPDGAARPRSIADLGAGAGFPGLPLADLRSPAPSVALVESSSAQVRVHRAGDRGSPASRTPAASTPGPRRGPRVARYDLVTARALAPLAVVAEYAAPLLRVGGTLVAWRGRRDLEAEAPRPAAAASSAWKPACDRSRSSPIRRREHRHLHLMLKVRETPARFPRRAGDRPQATARVTEHDGRV